MAVPKSKYSKEKVRLKYSNNFNLTLLKKKFNFKKFNYNLNFSIKKKYYFRYYINNSLKFNFFKKNIKQ